MSITNASIVLYKTSEIDLIKLTNSLKHCSTLNTVFFVDNSPDNSIMQLIQQIAPVFHFEYIHLPDNPGFGAAHNTALKASEQQNADYHFIVNPDVFFEEDILKQMTQFMNDNPDVGMMMPQILNEDGTVQNLPKLLPSPASLLLRKIKKPARIYRRFINNYELRFVKYDVIYEAPVLSGCFTVLRMSALEEVGMYDDRFFMYFEDWDLSRRMHRKFRTVYFPEVSVVHRYESGANSSSRLFKIFVSSAIKYFTKWGWIFDSERKKINKKALSQFS